MRHPDNAVTRLAHAVARIGRHEWPVRLTPSMQVLLSAVGEGSVGSVRKKVEELQAKTPSLPSRDADAPQASAAEGPEPQA